jgi:hypothetical protein
VKMRRESLARTPPTQVAAHARPPSKAPHHHCGQPTPRPIGGSNVPPTLWQLLGEGRRAGGRCVRACVCRASAAVPIEEGPERSPTCSARRSVASLVGSGTSCSATHASASAPASHSLGDPQSTQTSCDDCGDGRRHGGVTTWNCTRAPTGRWQPPVCGADAPVTAAAMPTTGWTISHAESEEEEEEEKNEEEEAHIPCEMNRIAAESQSLLRFVS